MVLVGVFLTSELHFMKFSQSKHGYRWQCGRMEGWTYVRRRINGSTEITIFDFSKKIHCLYLFENKTCLK